MTSILKTADLIRSIKRRAMIPSSQETFTDVDLLEMATEEINLGLVPLIQRMHEEHLVYYIDFDLEEGKRRYPIPPRAHGNKLRDVALIDENENAFEMHRYSLNELSDFSNTTAYINARGFYLENNDVILTNFQTNIGQKLRMYFYMRPNALILESNGAVIETITDLIEVDKISPITKSITSLTPNGDNAIILCPNHGIANGRKVSLSGIILSDLSVFSGIYEIYVIDSNNFSITSSVALSGTGGSLTLMLDVRSIKFETLPSHMVADELFDFVQHESPNKILYYNVIKNDVSQTLNTMSFPASSIPDVKVGDYTTAAEETIVPNIPSELHPILAQRVAIACLEAMGDEQNKQSAERKLAAMEKDAGTFLDNRVEGAQIKIKSRHSPLVNTLNTLGRRNRRW
jgi:hypothetical protein